MKFRNLRGNNHLILFSLVLLSITGMMSVDAMQTDRPYVYELRDLDNPMTEAEILGLQESLTANRSRLICPGTGNQSIFASAYPMISENGTIVAYGFSIDEEGTTHQMMGVVNDGSDIEAVHEKAGQWLEKIGNKPDPLSPPYVQNGWITLSEGDYYYEARPYGSVENNFELYYNIDEVDPDHEWYAVQQIFSMDPGFHRWREGTWSKWAGESGRCWNNWSYAAPTLHPSLHDHEPLGTRVGLENLLSVFVEDNSDPVTRTARWDMSITSPEAKKTEQRWNVGSSMVTHISDAAGEYCLTRLWAQGRFVDPTSPWYDPRHRDLGIGWNLRVEYEQISDLTPLHSSEDSETIEEENSPVPVIRAESVARGYSGRG